MAAIFSDSARARISAAVKKVEGMKDDRTGKGTPAGPQEQTFYAYITGCDISGKRYSWLRVYPDMSADTPDIMFGNSAMKWNIFGNDETITGYQTAYEANGQAGLTDRVVELRFAGYNANGDASYMFIAEMQPEPELLPIHDHRDNITGGGFAFAVYHPGTGLPQQPWTI